MKISKLNITPFKEIMKSDKYRMFIFDCDGVVWHEEEMIPEALESIKILAKEGREIVFLTNKNRSSRNEIHSKILSFGLNMVDKNSVYPSSYITAKHIKDKCSDIKNVYLIGREGLKVELEECGLEVEGGPSDDNKKLTVDQAPKLNINPKLQAVVAGSDDYINYYKFCSAINVAYKSKLIFGTNYDHSMKVEGRLIPGAYSFISAIETATDVKAEIVAKPNKGVLDLILKDKKIENNEKSRSQVLMIGDSLRTDIKFANNCGIDSCLIFTGQTTEDDYSKLLQNGSISAASPTYLIQDMKI